MRFASGGEVVAVDSELPWASRIIARGTGSPVDDPGEPTVRLHIERATAPFDRGGMRTVTRGAYSDGHSCLLGNVGGSGFDLSVVDGDPPSPLDITARYRPGAGVRVANRVLDARFALLAVQVLVHYPILWRAGRRGRVPLHASVVATAAGTPLLAGPGGVGKSTVVARALDGGAVATAHNLCCADSTECFGLAEPLRTDATGRPGARTSHGRVERPFAGRVPVLTADRVVVLERGPSTEIVPLAAEVAARALVAGTYAAGELRRYWAFAATLSLATGATAPHPPILEVARAITEQLPCLRVRVGDGETVTAAQLCGVDQSHPTEEEVPSQ